VAATLSMIQSNGAGNTLTAIGSSGNCWNYQTADVATPATYAANPITFGNNSYEVWLRAMFLGTFNEIRDLRMWMSTNFSPSTGLFLFFRGTQQIYLQPSTVTSSIATSSMPTADPGTANISIGGNLSGSLLTSSGISDYIVTQLRTTTAAPAGDTSFAQISLSYSES
jgi:hypothetical protein